MENINQIKKIIMEERIWRILRNTEVDEKLVQRRGEPEKEISENKFQLVNICK